MATLKTIDDSTWQQLLADAKAGDSDVIGQLLQLYWHRLWEKANFYIDTQLQLKQSPSDVVQETCLKAQASFGDFRGESPAELEAWLLTILQNNMKDTWRYYHESSKRMISRERPLQAMDQHFIQPEPTPSQRFAMNAEEGRIQETLQQLPEHYRQILLLRYWEGLTFDVIGQRIGKSPDASRQLWYRALNYFTAIYETNGS